MVETKQVLVGKAANGESLDIEGNQCIDWVVEHSDHLKNFVDSLVEVGVTIENHCAFRKLLLLVLLVLQRECIKKVSN